MSQPDLLRELEDTNLMSDNVAVMQMNPAWRQESEMEDVMLVR